MRHSRRSGVRTLREVVGPTTVQQVLHQPFELRCEQFEGDETLTSCGGVELSECEAERN